MERAVNGRWAGGTGKDFYVHVSPEDTKGLIQEAQDFVTIQDPEATIQTEVLTSRFQSVKDGLVRESTVTHDLTHKTVTIEFKILPESELLFHPKA